MSQTSNPNSNCAPETGTKSTGSFDISFEDDGGSSCNSRNFEWVATYTGEFTLESSTAPTINVFSPTNTTYTTSTIYFNATNDTEVDTWVLNYNGTNITNFNINTTLSVEDGFHHLFLYANGTGGDFGLNDSIYFTVDQSGITSCASLIFAVILVRLIFASAICVATARRQMSS